MNCQTYPKVSETVYRTVLPNGLSVQVLPRPGFSRKMAYFVTDFGSIHREFTWKGQHYQVPAGIAHFLEHKMFDMPNRDVSAELAALGANVNAFTGYDVTAYYFSGTDNFYESLKILLEFVSTPYFTKESVEKEQGIIDQEIGMNVDAPDTRVFESLACAMYRHHDIRTPILGTSQSIRQITPELLTACHQAFYVPGNMILSVVGDVDPEQVAQLARQVLGDEVREVGVKIQPQEEEMTCIEPFCRSIMEIAMPSFQIGFKCEPTGTGEKSILEETVGELAGELLFGEASRLYLKLYEQGLIDNSFSGGLDTLDNCAFLSCGGDSCDPEAVRQAILDEAQRMVAEGLDETDFLRMKRSAMGRKIRGLDNFDNTCYRMCAYALVGFDYFTIPHIYEQVTSEMVRQFIERVVRQERCSLSVIQPLKEETVHE